MKSQILYIEHKTGQSDRGDAWIGRVEFSKTGQTVYFNNQCFKKMKAGGISGNFYDLETGDEYWISGIKKNGQDRHRTGGGTVNIEASVVEEYLTLVDADSIDKLNLKIVIIPNTDKARFEQIENKQMDNAVKRKRKKNMRTEG